ncbi:MAG: ABC transporter ATP-binding protein [Clostridia bacterium]|nr:ABC transporter ATP-binding protein [Clostridia bacterium]
MRKLLKYIKPYWKTALLAPVLMMVEVAGDLLQPVIMARIVDEGVARGDLTFVLQYGALMIGIALIGLAGGWGCGITSTVTALNFATDLRSQLYRKIQQLSFVDLDRFKTESLITRLTNDVTQVQILVIMALRMLVRAPLLAAGSLLLILVINLKMALILAVALPLLLLSVLLIIYKGLPLFQLVQEKLDKVNGVIRENLGGVRVVKAFVREDREKQRFSVANDEQIRVNKKAARLMILMQPATMTIMNCSMVAVLWFGGKLVAAGSLQIGEVIALINYFSRILFAFTMVTFMMMGVSRARVSANRINEVLAAGVEITGAPGVSAEPVQTGEVDFVDVTFQYGEKGRPVLDGINLTVKHGETVAILGATGSGKSTLVNLIPRLYEVTKGRILVDGRDIREIQLRILRDGISMVPQNPLLFTGSVKENIRWGKPDATEEEVIAAAKAAQAHDFIMQLPQGYDSMLGQRGVNLSGGQKQRLAIARAIIKKPKILILDDSTSALDLKTESRLWVALQSFLQDTTCFIITQRITTVMRADQIILLEKGRIAGCGSHGELLRTNPLYQEIYRSQVGEEVVANG